MDELIEHLEKAKLPLTSLRATGRSTQGGVLGVDSFLPVMGLFEFIVLPFGLHGATFQRLMDQVLCGLAYYTCGGHLKEVLDRLQSVFTIGGGVIKPQVDEVQSH